MIRTRTKTASLAVAAVLALGITACSSGTASNSTTAAGTGTLNGKGALVVVFMPSTSNVYLKADADALTKEAATLNYKVKVIENNFDQNQEDQQVQQFLATGQKAAAFLYWPATDEAGINSSRLLSQKAPVVQFNQAVLPKAEKYVKAYAGVSDIGIGATAGKEAVKSLAEDKKNGRKYLGGAKPNLISITFPTGYQAGIDRQSSFEKEVGSSFNSLDSEPAPTVDAQGGFTVASQIIPKFKDKGIDYIYAHSNNVAVGVIKALQQNGLTPGKDVTVIAGDFSGDKQPLKAGQIYSAVVQSPAIEGALAMDTVAKYLATGKVINGTQNVPGDAVKPKLKVEAPYKVTIMPNPPIQPSNFNSFKIWGLGINQLEF
jgi:ABC-type sugar transport system substrate-binding protein